MTTSLCIEILSSLLSLFSLQTLLSLLSLYHPPAHLLNGAAAGSALRYPFATNTLRCVGQFLHTKHAVSLIAHMKIKKKTHRRMYVSSFPPLSLQRRQPQSLCHVGNLSLRVRHLRLVRAQHLDLAHAVTERRRVDVHVGSVQTELGPLRRELCEWMHVQRLHRGDERRLGIFVLPAVSAPSAPRALALSS